MFDFVYVLCVSCIQLVFGESFNFSMILCFNHVHYILYNSYLYGSLWFCVWQECLEFEEGFYEQWRKSLLMGTNFFNDTKGNVINIEFEETLLAQRQFRAVEQIMWFYKLNDVYYVCSLYCGDQYFRIRVFDLD